MHYDYSKNRLLEEIIEETRLRLKPQERFMKTWVNLLIKPLFLAASRYVYKEVKAVGLENIEEMKKRDYSIITYNHMFDFDVVEVIYHLSRKGVLSANVAKHEFFYNRTAVEKFLCWLMEGSGSFPVYLEYEEADGIRLGRGRGELDRKKITNFFNQFWAYLYLKKPVTIAINGSITRERKFPTPEKGLAYLLINAPERIGVKAEEINIFPVGIAFIGDLGEYNKILFDKKHYKGYLRRNYEALKSIRKKISVYLSFGKPFTLESAMKNYQEMSPDAKRELLSAQIMGKIKEEVRNAWNAFQIEEKYDVRVEDYLKGK